MAVAGRASTLLFPAVPQALLGKEGAEGEEGPVLSLSYLSRTVATRGCGATQQEEGDSMRVAHDSHRMLELERLSPLAQPPYRHTLPTANPVLAPRVLGFTWSPLSSKDPTCWPPNLPAL